MMGLVYGAGLLSILLGEKTFPFKKVLTNEKIR
jgi:hypothetical protein